MKFSMIGQENGDCLIEVTAGAGLPVFDITILTFDKYKMKLDF